jgi:chitin synthase
MQSWGTKGDNTAIKDTAPAISSNENGAHVFVVSVPEDDNECSENWQAFKKTLIINKNHNVGDTGKRSLETKKEDNCKEFRTTIILWWLISNVILVFLIR